MTFEKIEGGKAKDPKVEVLNITSIEQLAKMYVDVKKERDVALLQKSELEAKLAHCEATLTIERHQARSVDLELKESNRLLGELQKGCSCGDKYCCLRQRQGRAGEIDVHDPDTCIPKPTGRALQYCSEYQKTSHDHSPTCTFWVKEADHGQKET